MSRRSKKKQIPRSHLVNQDPPPNVLPQVRAQVAFAAWAAPLPPPDLLTRYNEAFDGCAERIVGGAELQSAHRQRLETAALTGKIESEHRGQTMAFTLALVILLGGFMLIYLNKSVLGTVFIGSDIAALVGVFLYGKREQKSQLKAKAQQTFPRPD